MHKDASYHRAAIQYNEELAIFAEELAESLEHEEVARWCRSVAKQHKFHAGRHRKALARLKKPEGRNYTFDDSRYKRPEESLTPIDEADESSTDIAAEQEKFALQQEKKA